MNMTVTINISKTAAILAGLDQCGQLEVPVPKNLSEQERVTLAREASYIIAVSDQNVQASLEDTLRAELSFRATRFASDVNTVVAALQSADPAALVSELGTTQIHYFAGIGISSHLWAAILKAPGIADKIAIARDLKLLADEARNRQARLEDDERQKRNRAIQELQEAAQLKARQEKEQLEQAKKDQIAQWVRKNGTSNQKERFARGVLPLKEVLDPMRDECFAPLTTLPRYQRITEDEVRSLCGDGEVAFSTEDLSTWSEQQYALFAKIQKAMPDATIQLRLHMAFCDSEDDHADSSDDQPAVTRCAALVTIQVGAFSFSREFACP